MLSTASPILMFSQDKNHLGLAFVVNPVQALHQTWPILRAGQATRTCHHELRDASSEKPKHRNPVAMGRPTDHDSDQNVHGS